MQRCLFRFLKCFSLNGEQQELNFDFFILMKNFLANDRSKWIFVIGLFAIGAGFTAKNVISFPTECLPDKAVEIGRA